jgi:putative ABC transport system permease protein
LPGENPIGERITPRISDDATGPAEREIIGIVGNTQHHRLGGEPAPGVFLPAAQCIGEQMVLVLRSNEAAEALMEPMRHEVAEGSRAAAVYEATTMEQHLSEVAAHPRLNSVLLTIYALVAVVVAAIGVYGVMMAYAVVQR